MQLRGPCTVRGMAYDIHTDVTWGPLEVVDAGALVDACTEPWWNQSLCVVGGSVARIGVERSAPGHGGAEACDAQDACAPAHIGADGRACNGRPDG